MSKSFLSVIHKIQIMRLRKKKKKCKKKAGKMRREK